MDQAQGLNVYDLMYYLTPFPIHFLGLQTRLVHSKGISYLSGKKNVHKLSFIIFHTTAMFLYSSKSSKYTVGTLQFILVILW